MKARLFTYCSLLLIAMPAQARLIKELSYDQLKEMAGAVVIIQFIEREAVDDIPPFVDKHHPAKNYQAWNGRFRVLSTLRSDIVIGEELTLLYFNYNPEWAPHNNGAGFLTFPVQPQKLFLIKTDDGSHHGKITSLSSASDYSSGPMPVYLAYLEQRDDGRFQTVGDQYDANLAFKQLSFPFPYSNYTQDNQETKPLSTANDATESKSSGR